MVVPVTRDTAFAHLRPDRLNVIRIASNLTDKYELRLQSFVYRETSQRINLAPGGDLAVMSRDISMEVRELGTVDLTLPQMQKLRDDLTRELYTAQVGVNNLATLPPYSAQELSTASGSSHVAPADLAIDAAASSGAAYGPQRAAWDTRDASWAEPEFDAPLPDDAPADTMEAVYPHPLFDQLSPEPLPTAPKRFRRYGFLADVGFWVVLGSIGLVFYFVDPLTLRARLSAWPDLAPPAAQNRAESGAIKHHGAEASAHAAVAPTASTPPVTPPGVDLATSTAPALAEAAPPAPSPTPATPAAAAAPKTTPVLAAPTPPIAVPHLVITVRSSSWVIVSDDNGTLYFEKLMKPGETWTVPPIPGLQLRAGNAGATSLVVDGVTKPPLGADNTLWTGPLED